MKYEKKVSIITPTRGREEEIIKWINNINELNYKNKEIIIVDNNEDLKLYNYITKNHKNVKIIKSKKNLGYAGSCYLASFYATGDILHFTNDDVYFNPDYFDEIVKNISKDGSIGMAGGTVLNKDDTILQTVTRKSIFFTFLGEKKRNKEFSNYKNLKGYYPTDFISGCNLNITREALFGSGNWYPELFIYAEEVDLALRVKEANYKIIYVPKAICRHCHVTKSKSPERVNFLMARNRLVVLKRNLGKKFIYQLIFDSLLFFPYLIIKNVILLRFKEAFAFIKGYGEGINIILERKKLEALDFTILKSNAKSIRKVNLSKQKLG